MTLKINDLLNDSYSQSRLVVFIVIFCVTLSCIIMAGSNCQADVAHELNGVNEKLGYALGIDIGKSLKKMDPPISLAMLLRGIKDVYLGHEILLSPNEAYDLKKNYAENHSNVAKRKDKANANIIDKQIKMKGGLLAWRKEASIRNKRIGERFLRKNKQGYGVGFLVSGLQYMVITEGKGLRPKLSDIVKIHYTVSLLSGKEFDSSITRAEPAVFPLNRTIKGWQEILQMMRVGSKYRVFIPARLAYGSNGAGTLVEPNSTLICEIELLGIEALDVYQKSDYFLRLPPPYTDPAQRKIRLNSPVKKVELRKRDILKEYHLSLQSVEDTASAFINLYNSLMPVSTLNDVTDFCRVLSTVEGNKQCVETLYTRVEWLKSLSGLKGADFPDGKFERDSKLEDRIDVSWIEILFFEDGEKQKNEKHMKLWMEEKDNLWKVQEIHIF